MLNVAVIGLGWWGSHVANALQGNRKLRVVRGVELNPTAATRKLAKNCGFELTTDYAEALKDPNVEGVILTTPHTTHEALLMQAARANKQIFCEKPLSLTSASAKKMVKACRDRGIVLGLGHERRYEPAWMKMAEMVRKKELGTIIAVEANNSHDKFTPLKADNWRGNPKDAPAAGWTGMGVHLTDMMISMFGPIQWINAASDRRVLNLPSGDVVTTQFQFKDRTLGTINVVSKTPYYARFAVFGSKGWVEIHDIAHPEDWDDTYMDISLVGKKRTRKVYKPRDTVKMNFEAWADAVAGKKKYMFTDVERIGNVAVLEALAKSAKSGKRERVRN
ncbi:MAG: Gfo/Idh/MocA family oxidoreductase [Rhodospirillaceae bacterium]|jgi:predicted dehydrogenase|nr:Gfo/Idh/MocA family oxidoreductase [Rhodospirillaceae bacterium]